MSARRTVILDGYNVILRSPAFQPDDRRDLAQARDKLVNLLSWAVGAGDVEFLLVFDGAEGVTGGDRHETIGSRRVRVQFSKPPRKADDDIRDLLEEWKGSISEVTVVTSDLEVAAHARALGASIVLSDVFAASLFPERTRERIEELERGRGGQARGRGPHATGRGPQGARASETTGSPTAEGSDAEAKPTGVSKREARKWLEMFESGSRAGDEEDESTGPGAS